MHTGLKHRPVSDVPAEIVRQLAAGAFGAVCFAILFLVFDANDLTGGNILAIAVTMIGAVFTFAPLVLCVAIGGVRRGEQSWKPLIDLDD